MWYFLNKYIFMHSIRILIFFRVSSHYSTSAIAISMLLSTFSLLIALVCLSGYLITCDELSYETTRQIHGRTTLGNKTIPCPKLLPIFVKIIPYIFSAQFNYEICFQVHPLASSAFIVGLCTETKISIRGSIMITSNIVVNGTDNTEGINMDAYILQPMTMSMPLA